MGLLSVLAVLAEAAGTGQAVDLEAIGDLLGRLKGAMHTLQQRGFVTNEGAVFRPFA